MDKVKLRFWVDVAMLLTFILTALAGVCTFISSDSASGFLRISSDVWFGMHLSFASATFVLVMIHLGMHLDFISFAVKKIFRSKE
jgi:hypothetical protein